MLLSIWWSGWTIGHLMSLLSLKLLFVIWLSKIAEPKFFNNFSTPGRYIHRIRILAKYFNAIMDSAGKQGLFKAKLYLDYSRHGFWRIFLVSNQDLSQCFSFNKWVIAEWIMANLRLEGTEWDWLSCLPQQFLIVLNPFVREKNEISWPHICLHLTCLYSCT